MTINVAEVKRRLQVLLHDDNLVNLYIRQFGPSLDIKNIKKVKEQQEQVSYTGEGTGGDDPVFEQKLSCPVCNQPEIVCYQLRAKSQQVTQNKFLVPIYEGAAGYRTVDYTILAVTVCPRCLFASPDRKDFNRPASANIPESKSQLMSNVIISLQEKIGERKAIAQTVSNPEEFFKRPRIAEAGVISYRLAMARASVEAWFELPYSYYKMGAYALKIAGILKACDNDNTLILREALGFIEESFKNSECNSEEIELQVIYTIVALHIKFGELKKAQSYMGVYSNLKNARKAEMAKDPRLNTNLIDRWEDKVKRLWEDREYEDLFAGE
ncbi:MAG: DUF2225 domain-containing protein [Chitinivibrionales bacterium]|nr:DUF2225 domain-containing protein [Chitinivibrionales bacterium]